MKRNTIRFICIILVLALTTYSVYAKDVSIVDDIPFDLQYAMQHNQDIAIAAYEKLANYLGMDELKDSYDFPKEYAGCFIDDDNKLIVCLTDISEEVKNKYIDICGNSIDFQSAKFSQNEIEKLCYVLEDYDGVNNIRVGYSNKENKLIISCTNDEAISINRYLSTYKNNPNTFLSGETSSILDKNLNNMIKFFCKDNTEQNLFSKDIAIEQEINNSESILATTLKLGSKISNSIGSSFTLGVWATKVINGNTYAGIVTCAHPFFKDDIFNSSSSIVYAGSTSSEIGLAKSPYTKLGGLYDCAFVALSNPNYTPTNELSSGGYIDSVYTKVSIVEGANIFIVGQKSGLIIGKISLTGSTTGVTISTGYTIEILTPYTVALGDSGGPVYFIDTKTNTRKLIGFQSAGSSSAGDGKYRYAEVAYAWQNLNILQATFYEK